MKHEVMGRQPFAVCSGMAPPQQKGHRTGTPPQCLDHRSRHLLPAESGMAVCLSRLHSEHRIEQ